jgi:hypothetical protein
MKRGCILDLLLIFFLKAEQSRTIEEALLPQRLERVRLRSDKPPKAKQAEHFRKRAVRAAI